MNLGVITRAAGKVGLVLSKHSPAMLSVIGGVGVVATAVLASQETLRVKEVVEPHVENLELISATLEDESKQYSDQDALHDRTVIYARLGRDLLKLYAPALVVGVLTIASIAASHRISAKRIAGLTAAYGALDQSYRRYRGRVEQALGEEGMKELDTKIREQAKKDIAERRKPDADISEIGDSIFDLAGASQYAVLYDENAATWNKNRNLSTSILRAQENYANDLLNCRGYVMLNEVYAGLGLPQTSAGAVVGWIRKDDGGADGYITFGDWDANYFDDIYKDVDGVCEARRWILDFNVDGVIWDRIDEVSVR
jgi:hypothetical protein